MTLYAERCAPIAPNEVAAPANIVIFGATGDLTRRKLLPALIRMLDCGLVHADSRILGVVNNRTREVWLQLLFDALRDAGHPISHDEAKWRAFCERLIMVPGDLADDQTYRNLAEALCTLDGCKHAMFYCAIPPAWYGRVAEGLGKQGLTAQTEGYRRIVIEKPFGSDLESSRQLNTALHKAFDENQIYRIDHYLGKETVMNLIALRFANSIFTTNWDHNTIDHVQITVAEEVGIEGRWGYFDRSGQLRDMVQNHLMQILTLIAMEPPVSLDADSLRNEKLKVLKALRPITWENVEQRVVRGQYGPGFIKGRAVPGYLEEEGANKNSTTETFVAIRVDIDNWRWAEVPFYLRTGKAMATKRSQVVINFKRLPHNLFASSYKTLPPNKLIINLQPNEGIEVEMLNKVPGIGTGIRLQRTRLDLSFSEAFHGERIADAYERLILEVMNGNQALFIHREEVELSWRWIDSIQEAWSLSDQPPKSYPAGSWGPVASVALLARDGREWEE